MITYRQIRSWRQVCPNSRAQTTTSTTTTRLPKRRPPEKLRSDEQPEQRRLRLESKADRCRRDESFRARVIKSLNKFQRRVLKWHWPFWARRDQIAPDWLWDVWLILAGRGWGKTRTGAQWVIDKARKHPGCRIALVGRSYNDVRKVMIEGDSGILKCSPPHFRPDWQPGNQQLIFPNGSICDVYGAENPDKLRGPQHHFAWCDELAAWRWLQDTWDQVGYGLRLGVHEGIHPQIVVTTTPRPIAILRAMARDPHVHVTCGSTFDNELNLAAATIRKLKKLIGTDDADQELYGIILDLSKGALWQQSAIEALYVRGSDLPKMERVVVVADPGEETGPDNDATGIVVVGLGWDGIGYVLEEHSGKHRPAEWADIVLNRAAYYGADVVVETNKGGQMVVECVAAATVRREKMTGQRWTPRLYSVKAIGSKGLRSGPTSILYRDGFFRHVGRFDQLEEEMTTYVPGIKQQRSPNALDALNIAAAHLFKLTTDQNGGVTMKFKPEWVD